MLSGIWAFPTLQVTVMGILPFTFPRRVLKNGMHLEGSLLFRRGAQLHGAAPDPHISGRKVFLSYLRH